MRAASSRSSRFRAAPSCATCARISSLDTPALLSTIIGESVHEPAADSARPPAVGLPLRVLSRELVPTDAVGLLRMVGRGAESAQNVQPKWDGLHVPWVAD